MFRQLLFTLTLLSTGAHAVFGCCWHHEHGECVADSHQETEASSDESHACCSHDSRSHRSESVQQGDPEENSVVELQADSHSAPHACDEHRCEFLFDGRVRLDVSASADQPMELLPVALDVAIGTRLKLPPMWDLLANIPIVSHRGLRDLTEVAVI